MDHQVCFTGLTEQEPLIRASGAANVITFQPSCY